MTNRWAFPRVSSSESTHKPREGLRHETTTAGSNKTEVEFTDGTTVFFSYETPVALQDADGNYFKTEDFWSVTTSKHINQWLKSRGADYCDTLTQDSINARATV